MIANTGSDLISAFVRISQRTLALACLTFALTACGGGGGGGGGADDGGGGGAGNNQPPPTLPPPSGPTAEEISNAQNAQLRMLQNGQQLIINWVDLFDNERGYQLERRVGDGEWQIRSGLPAGNGGVSQWQMPIDASGSYRLVALLDGYSLPLHAAPNETEMPIELGSSPVSIDIDQTEPVRGNVQVSVQNAEPALSVTYTLDSVPVAQSTGGGTFTATLPAEHLVDGQRTLRAVVQKTQGLTISISRPLRVDNPDPAVLLNYSLSPRNANAAVTLYAKASSDAGIVSVAFFANDNLLQVATAPSSSGWYVVELGRATLPTGETKFRTVATDNNGATVIMERTVTVDHFPSLDVSGLFDGMIAANGRVDVQASFGDDRAGATLTVTVGDRRLVQTQTSPLVGSYSLADVPPGEYPVIVRVRDTAGNVNLRLYRLIVPSTTLSYELLATDAERLLAADDGTLLYRKHSGAIVLRNAAGVETTIPNAPYTYYRFTDGRLVAHQQTEHVYVVEPSGQLLDLTPDSQFMAFLSPNLSGPWVSWVPINTPQLMMVHNLRTAQTTRVSLGASTYPLARHDLVGPPGAEQLLFSATFNGATGIYSRDLATGTTTLLVSGRNSDVQSDGTRLTWRQNVNPGLAEHQPLMAAPLNNPTAAAVLSPHHFQSFVDDGLICWLDRDFALHVNDGSISTRLAGNVTLLHEHTLEDGRVIYPDDGVMNVWTPANGEQVWLDTLATESLQADGVAYFLTGSSGTLYRVSLP